MLSQEKILIILFRHIVYWNVSMESGSYRIWIYGNLQKIVFMNSYLFLCRFL